jgi:hypothetical protein
MLYAVLFHGVKTNTAPHPVGDHFCSLLLWKNANETVILSSDRNSLPRLVTNIFSNSLKFYFAFT